jgi:phage terminase large subunit-like protein
MAHPERGPFNFQRALRVVQFIECLTIPSGKGQGEPFKLLKWQKDFIFNVYAPMKGDGKRRIRRAILSIGRKNGKTALAAALVLVHLIGPEARLNAELYSAASDRNQAAIIFKAVRQMVELDEELEARCKVISSTKRIAAPTKGSFYNSLSAEARRQHGFNPAFVIYDELAQAKHRELYDVLSTSFGAQDEPLFLIISTQSPDPSSIMTEIADEALAQMAGLDSDPSFYGIVYAVPNDEKDGPKVDIYDERIWKLANPALGQFRDMDDFRTLAYKAKKSASSEAPFRNLFLNQRVDGATQFVSSLAWRACNGDVTDEELKGVKGYGAIDLSSKKDLASFKAVFPLPDGRVAVRGMSWRPLFEVEEAEKRDAAKYRQWAEQGWLTLVDKEYIDIDVIAKWVIEFCAKFTIESVGFDRYRIDTLKKAFAAQGIRETQIVLIEHGQGFRDMAVAVDELEEKILAGELLNQRNPVLTYCISNVKVEVDAAENRKFDKRTRNKRIDEAVALAMAMSLAAKKGKDGKKKRSYLEAGNLAAA